MFRIVLISSLLVISLAAPVNPVKRQTCPCSSLTLYSPGSSVEVAATTPTATYSADCLTVTVTCPLIPGGGIDMKANCPTPLDEVTYSQNDPVTATFQCINENYQLSSTNPDVGTPQGLVVTSICCSA
uniref:Uncharacterized protein n=1 Tax=Acrobeloides nanus TaxID=290746 RepID=A0A914E8V6_9BILA